ncbi:MAG: SDR family oxidoreductase [Denitromonas halophila]|nr:MAG: SDR family oxidoreductase [Denitromonas halophila]TVT68196.1 MAG: SDR family oxidoreductase [Denitromonas halophila]
MKIGITGADGLLGFHLRARLHALGGHEVRLANRVTFDADASLDTFVGGLDALVHFAGMNRGDEQEVEAVNSRLAEALVGAMTRTGATPVVVFSNSTHVDRDTGYGRGKRRAAEVLADWAAERSACFTDLVLPHVFGEFGRPFANSVVSTFCHQLAKGEAPEIHVDGQLELVHAQAVAERCLAAVLAGESGRVRMAGEPIKVSALLDRLRELQAQYSAQIMPALPDPLTLRLFNTLRSYLFPAHYPVALTLHTDNRGSLFEAVKTHQGGQTFLSTTRPGITRGNHFHLRKVERFLVVSGEAEICLRKLFSGEVIRFRVSGSAPCYIDMPTFHTHSITNVGEAEVVTLFWANEIFDPADSDTYAEAVVA